MGIYIEGIDMPKDDELLCIDIYPDGKVCINLDLNNKQVATAVNTITDILSALINAESEDK